MTNPSEPYSAPNVAVAQAKYSDRSPLVRFANQRFFGAIDQLLKPLTFESVLDAGCGEGVVIERIEARSPSRIFGMDLDLSRLRLAKADQPARKLVLGDLHRLPFASGSFDLVLVLEVFEHVGEPAQALREVARVGRTHLLASVPNEPWWRIGNMLRLKYLRQWGNTPEHIQHWTVWGFRKFISQVFSVIELKTPFLWTFVLARKA